MTLEEFLRWDDGTDTHYELIGGFPVAMAPPAAAAQLHRRSGTQSITEILRGPDAMLSLTSAGMEVRLGELYEGIALAESCRGN
ncbi:MAG: hypothetical protein AB7H71_09785 [Alphaproteobacteria bacterium]